MRNWFRRMWADLNYRYCMSNRYLASQRGETLTAVQWERNAWDWRQEYFNA